MLCVCWGKGELGVEDPVCGAGGVGGGVGWGRGVGGAREPEVVEGEGEGGRGGGGVGGVGGGSGRGGGGGGGEGGRDGSGAGDGPAGIEADGYGAEREGGGAHAVEGVRERGQEAHRAGRVHDEHDAAFGKTPFSQQEQTDGLTREKGIDGVLYYAPLLFQQAGLVSDSSSFLASGLSGVVIFATTIPAVLLADRWPRRVPVVHGGFALTAIMLVIGSLYASGSVASDHGAGRWVVVAFIFLFTFVYSATWAVTITVYASEVQPIRTRAAASSLGRSGNWIVNWIVAFTTPIFLMKSSYGVYFLFGGSCLVTSMVCFLWMPETRGLSLEEIDHVFERDGEESRVESIVNFVRGRDEKR